MWLTGFCIASATLNVASDAFFDLTTRSALDGKIWHVVCLRWVFARSVNFQNAPEQGVKEVVVNLKPATLMHRISLD